MPSKKDHSLIPSPGNREEIAKSITGFSKPLSSYMEHLGLPTKNILSSTEERRRVITNLPDIIKDIPVSDRKESVYLSKFSVAVAAGLFDGALNYLWDETILAIRLLVQSFDLNYFFSVAEASNARYRGLSTAEDLQAIADHDLLDIARRIGIINDIIYKRLETVNYFRNHASAAHPNENEISGTELLAYLEQCIKYAIRAEVDVSAVNTKKLFDNIRNHAIPATDFSTIAAELIKQPQERLDDFALSLFGLYCDVRQDQFVRQNIEGIYPDVWAATSEDVKFRIGAKFGYFRKNGEVDKKNLVDRLMTHVCGLAYKDEDSLAEELIEKLQELKTTHFSFNNFYNEHPHALLIRDSLPKSGIPSSARKDFVKVISICYIGNGLGYRNGVDERAIPHYEEFIARFEDKEISLFLSLFKDIEFTSDLTQAKAAERTRTLASRLRDKAQNLHIKNALSMVAKSKHLDGLGNSGEFERTVQKIKL